MDYGFIRVASAIPSLRVADCSFNANEILRLMEEASNNHSSIICFPELSITGYTCGDLFSQQLIIEESLNALMWITNNNTSDIIAIIGLPLEIDNALYNCAVTIHKDKIIGVVPKTFIPNYKEFYEQRWFETSKSLRSDKLNLKNSE